MSAKLAVTAYTVLFTAFVDDAHAISSIEQKAVIVRLCSKVISDYSAYLAGQRTPQNVRALEREYRHCSNVIYQYENLDR